MNLRSVPEGGFPLGVFESPLNPLLIINAESKYITAEFFLSEGEKRAAMGAALINPSIRLIFTWTGKFQSHIFEITTQDVYKILNGPIDPEVFDNIQNYARPNSD